MAKLAKPFATSAVLLVLATGSLLGATPGATFEDPPTIGPAPDSEPPNLTEMFALFERFDDLYAGRQRVGSAPADDWIAIATRLEEFTTAYISLDPEEGGQFAVRAVLIKGECHLFASIDLLSKKDSRFAEQYQLGIEHLVFFKIKWIFPKY